MDGPLRSQQYDWQDRNLNPLVPLDALRAGEAGEISDVDGPPDLVHRLSELGLRSGVRVRMQQPGQPCVLAIGDQRLSLRLEAEVIILVAVEVSPS